jgi:ATP-dependent RNA helicase SUPV3L1/SUV3
VKFGAFTLHLPALRTPEAQMMLQAFAAVEAPLWRPAVSGIAALPSPPPPPQVLGWRGYARCGELAVAVPLLEALDTLVHGARREAGGVWLSDAALADMGAPESQVRRLLKALGYTPARRASPGEPTLWRRRGEATRPPAPEPVRDTPFAALAALQPQPASPRRRRRRPRKPAAA